MDPHAGVSSLPSEPVGKLVVMATLAVIRGGWDCSPLWEGFCRFIPRLSWRDGYLLRELPAGRATTVAKALAQAGGDAQLVLQAHRDPMRRVILDPEAWRNQQRPGERSAAFRQLGLSMSLRRTLDPASLRTSSARALIAYTESFINVEEARGADALLTPCHLAAGHGTASREGELRLAEATVGLVRREGIAERGERAKPLLVGVAVDAAALTDPAAAVALGHSYARLGADGFWVQFANLTEASPPDVVSTCSAFLYALQELSGRRVFAVDVKNLIWPLLAGGLFGACIGIGEREAWLGPQGSSTERRALKPTVVHPELLRNFVASGANARRAFSKYPCECDAHEPEEVPADRTSIRRHALRVRLLMADAATAPGAASVVESWLTEASWAAADLGLDQPCSDAYRAALAAARTWRAVDTR
jgi:hypothetical protein